MITRNFNLYLNAGHSVPLVINVNQYDQGEQWVFTLYNSDGTKYTPSTGAIVGIKSDGLGIINSGSVVDGNVVINETQQMTAAVGKAVFELMIDSQTHGTANFVVLVEEKPGNNADLSESDLSLLQEAIDATSPLPTGGTVGQVLTKTANGSAWSDAGTPTQEQVADAVSDWADEHITVSTGVVIDTSLAVAGAAADAKKTGDEITDLKSAISVAVKEVDTEISTDTEMLSRSDFTAGIMSPNGTVTSASAIGYLNTPIAVEPGETIKATKYFYNSGGSIGGQTAGSFRACAFFADNTFTYTNSGFSTARDSFVVPEGVYYIQPSLSAFMTGTYDHAKIHRITHTTTYALSDELEESIASPKVQALNDGTLTTKDLANAYAVALPKTKLRQTVGIAESWYKSSMITPPTERICVNGGYSTTVDDVDCVTFSNSVASSSGNGFVWYAYDDLFNLIYNFDYGTGWGAPMVRQTENLSDCSLLAIGDSTIDHDHITGKLLSYFTEKGHTITLLGTLGKSSEPLNKNEGRAGWTTADYMTNSTKNGYTNPFYNSATDGFDFSYYMSQQGYSGVDFVVIQLGINDLYPSSARFPAEPAYADIWANVKTMIDSILSYNSGIKVIINLPTTPNSDPSAHPVPQFLYQHYVIRYNEVAFNGIMEYTTTNVRPSYCHLILNPATDISDNVHPTVAGYEKMAMEVINQINCWQNGV